MFSKKMSVSQSSIAQVQVCKGKLQIFKTTHPIQDPAGITFFSSIKYGVFIKEGLVFNYKGTTVFKCIFVQINKVVVVVVF